MSWDGGDPNSENWVYYDIYFGQNPDNLTFIETIGPYPAFQIHIGPFDLGIVDSEGTYYWRIIARDNEGNQREGSTWEFTIYLYYIPSQPSQSKPVRPNSQQSTPSSS